MTRLDWGLAGDRFYEAGVDRGVLYINGAGVAWNGLTAVTEAPTGGDPTGFYLDGVKYANRTAAEEFTASIEAYTYPDEFAQCDGTLSVQSGLFATQQRRKKFDLSYRSMVGNDVDGINHAYKIHLIYNAKAQPSQSAYSSLADTISPSTFSWSITTKPEAVVGYKPTAHFVIDSRQTPDVVLAQIEDVLYGNDGNDPRMPSVGELVFIFETLTATVFDAGHIPALTYGTLDGGRIPAIQTLTVDGGRP